MLLSLPSELNYLGLKVIKGNDVVVKTKDGRRALRDCKIKAESLTPGSSSNSSSNVVLTIFDKFYENKKEDLAFRKAETQITKLEKLMDLYRKRNPDTFESNPKYQRAEDRLLDELEKDLSLDDKENVVTYLY